VTNKSTPTESEPRNENPILLSLLIPLAITGCDSREPEKWGSAADPAQSRPAFDPKWDTDYSRKPPPGMNWREALVWSPQFVDPPPRERFLKHYHVREERALACHDGRALDALPNRMRGPASAS
jgi:hypothetical protein